MTAPLKLYEIGDQYESIIQQAREADGVITPELAAQLDAVTDAFGVKVERCALYYRNLIASAEAADKEISRLRAHAATDLNAANGIKEYIRLHMERVGQTKVETPLIKVRIQRNSVPSVSVSSPSLEVGEEVPVRYQRVSITLDRKQVVDDWKAGTPLPEGITVEVGAHLRIS